MATTAATSNPRQWFRSLHRLLRTPPTSRMGKPPSSPSSFGLDETTTGSSTALSTSSSSASGSSITQQRRQWMASRTRNVCQQYVKEQFRLLTRNDNSAYSSSLTTTTAETTTATMPSQAIGNYVQLLRDLAERERLYQLDAGAEQTLSPKELSRRAAARAGLQLPLDVSAELPNGYAVVNGHSTEGKK